MQLRSSFKRAGLGPNISCGLKELDPIADLALNTPNGRIFSATGRTNYEQSGPGNNY